MQGLPITLRGAMRAATLVVGLVPAAHLLLASPAQALQDHEDHPAAARASWMTRPRIALRLLPGASPDAFAAAIGGAVVTSRPDLGLHLITAAPEADPGMVESMAVAFKAWPTVLYSETDEPIDPPEAATCGAPSGSASAAQCTIAFIDGYFQPSDYFAQAAVPQIDAGTGPSGAAMTVAVVDTGVDPYHPALSGHVLSTGYDYVLDVAGGYEVVNGIDDDDDDVVDEGAGHGTHVAGLIRLVDPAAEILPMRVLDSEGNGSSLDVAVAIIDSVDLGANLINLSLSSRGESAAIAEALMYAEYHGVSVVISSGNTGGEPTYPASYDPADFSELDPTWLPSEFTITGENVIVVSGIDGSDHKMQVASYGPEVDLCAPGKDSYSSYHSGQWATWTGTSMSCGLASGAASRLLSLWPTSYSGTLLDLLSATADDLDTENPSYAGDLGAGCIQVGAAIDVLLGS